MNIPEPSFVLKDCNANEPTLIYLQSVYSCGGVRQRVVLSTGNKIHPKAWDGVKKRVIISKRNQDYTEINLWLDKMATSFKSVFRNLIIDGITPTASIVKEKVEVSLNYKPVVKSLPISLYQFINQYIDECRNSKRPNTIKSYVTTFNKIKEYGATCNTIFDFEHLTLGWRADFLKFIQQLGGSRNTEGKHIKNIKVFLHEATERKLNENLDFKSRSFSKPHEEVKKPSINEEEISCLLNLDLGANRLQEIVRDFFVISCYTGLRFSDLTSLKNENIVNGTIEIHTMKTNEDVIIPLHHIVEAILAKYDNKFPKLPPNQVFNRYIKEIGKLAKLNRIVNRTKTNGGITNTKTYELWELLSCHTARRAFITNCSLKGMNPSTIMLMSGHKSLKVFQSYVSINKKQNAEQLKGHMFFNQSEK